MQGQGVGPTYQQMNLVTLSGMYRLVQIKKQLAIDQRNIVSGEVMSSSSGRVTIRSDKNEVLSALTSSAHVVGDLVQVRVDGAQREVIGSSLRGELPGVVAYQFDSGGSAVVETYRVVDDNGDALLDDDGFGVLIF